MNIYIGHENLIMIVLTLCYFRQNIIEKLIADYCSH